MKNSYALHTHDLKLSPDNLTINRWRWVINVCIGIAASCLINLLINLCISRSRVGETGEWIGALIVGILLSVVSHICAYICRKSIGAGILVSWLVLTVFWCALIYQAHTTSSNAMRDYLAACVYVTGSLALYNTGIRLVARPR